MAIKQRVLDKLATIEKDLMEASEAESQKALADALALLSETKNECRQGLPENRHGDYDELCDGLLFAVTQLVSGQAIEDKGEVLSLCSDLLQILNKKIEDEGGFKKEIVFLPYKSSMWDSLESVWRAAYEDKEHCIPYVIPIPYADLTPKHTVAEWHCEKDMFPKDMPVVDWQTVDLEKMHPDVIFIHNPYDEYNRVTSVESRYYSSNLKKCTNKLVYIPYFVLDEPEFDSKTDEEIEKMEENIAHFVTTPAVLNADQVVVQSEAMRRVYIDVLTRETNQKERAYWEKRIVGTGSPKFDKVFTTKKEDLDIPDAWLKIIEKADGSWKKIIFYNTSISALLQHNEKMLEKMRQVFQTFKKQKDEVALLWRPHPLMKAVLESMRPQLMKDYEEIVRQYKADRLGIYDDSADVDRAIVLSDAYYGDGSSVVQLYEKTRKPIMIQNIYCLDETRYRRLRFIDYYDDGENIWFAALHQNIIFKYQKNIDKTKLIAVLPADVLLESYRAIYKKESKLYLASIFAKDIVIIDINSSQCRHIALSEKYFPVSEQLIPLFCHVFEWQRDIYVIPDGYGAILRICPSTDELIYYDGLINLAKPLQRNGEVLRFANSCIYENCIYMAADSSNIIAEFNLTTKSFQIHRIGRDKGGYNAICAIKGKIFLLHKKNSAIISWDIKNETMFQMKVEMHGKYDYLMPFFDCVLRVPCKGDLSIEKIHFQCEKSVSYLNLRPQVNNFDVSAFYPENDSTLCVHTKENKIYVFITKRDSLCVFDSEGNFVHEYNMLVDTSDLQIFKNAQKERMKVHFSRSESTIIYEDIFSMNLPCYCAYITDREKKLKCTSLTLEYGKKIYKTLIRSKK